MIKGNQESKAGLFKAGITDYYPLYFQEWLWHRWMTHKDIVGTKMFLFVAANSTQCRLKTLLVEAYFITEEEYHHNSTCLKRLRK